MTDDHKRSTEGLVLLLLLGFVGAVAAQDGGGVAEEAEARCARAEALLKDGKPDEARAEYEQARALFLDAKNAARAAAVLGKIGGLLQQRRAYEQAAQVWKRYRAEQVAIHGGDHPNVSMALNEEAYCLFSLGRLAEALPLYEESLAMRRRLFEGDHPWVAAGLNNVASCLERLGRAREALPSYEEALAINRRLFEGDHPHVASSLNGVGYCLQSLGRLAEALPLYEESLAMRRRLFEGTHPAVAQGLNNLALCLKALGRPEDALPLIQESLAMCRRLFGGDHQYVATTLNNVALCLKAVGRPGEALPLFEESLAIRRRLFAGDHPEVALGLNNVASCLQALGRGGEALPLHEKSLAMWRRLFGGDHPEVARGLNNVAFCLQALGRAGEALPLYEKSFAMWRRLFAGDHPDVARAMDNVATCLDAIGRAGEALAKHEASLAMWRRLFGGDHPYVATTLNNIAACFEALGRVEEALPLLEEAVAMARRTADPGGYRYASHLARARLFRGEGAAAVPLLEEAIDQIEARRGGALGLTEGDRALYFKELKRYRAYEFMVAAQRSVGDDGEALRYVERARARSLLDLLDRSRLDPLAEMRAQARERGDEEAMAAITEVSKSLDEAHVEVGRRTHRLAELRPTGQENEERKAQVRKASDELAAARRAEQAVLRRMAQLVRAQLRVAQPADAAALQRLAGRDGRVLVYAVSEGGTVLFDVPPRGTAIRALDLAWPDGSAVTARSLAEKVEAHGRWIGAGRGDARGVVVPQSERGSPDAGRALFAALVPSWEDVQKAKVVYVVAGGALQRLAFESLPVRDGFWIDAGPAVVYGPSGSALLWSREQGDRQRSQGRLGEVVVLGDAVFAREGPPERGVVVVGVTDGGQAKRVGIAAGDVIVAYDGKEIASLEALGPAIQAASDEVTVTLWRAGERREVNVAAGPLGVRISREPVGDALRRLEDPQVSAERSGALSRYGELGRLPGTRREAEAIAKALGSPGPRPLKVTLLLGEAATGPNLRRAAPRARYLHLATHGLADETEFASYSSLALTLPRVPTAKDDGFLSLADVLAGWRGALTRCELVVLSACETQRGNEQRDEGVYALPVGFLYAGAPSVIGSLWRVDDASTAELFADFYKRLQEGKGKLGAFTEARRALKKTHPEPYFWAPFVYVGDPR